MEIETFTINGKKKTISLEDTALFNFTGKSKPPEQLNPKFEEFELFISVKIPDTLNDIYTFQDEKGNYYTMENCKKILFFYFFIFLYFIFFIYYFFIFLYFFIIYF
jgi:hypothetical protein